MKNPIFDLPYDPRTGTFGGEVVYFVEMPIEPDGLWIFGHTVGTPYVDDYPAFRNYLKVGSFYARCYSVACTMGEEGGVQMRFANVISKEDFERAKAAQWRVKGG